jgi:general secretion pathway protein H
MDHAMGSGINMGKIPPIRISNAPTSRLQRGFTLLEIIVVLVIIGIMVSFAVLQFGDEGEKQLKEETRRLELLVKLAREESILESSDYAIGFWQGGYSFYTLDEGEGKWDEITDDPTLRPREIPEYIELSIELEDQLVILEMEPPEKPQIFLLSSGEMTPFLLQLSVQDRDDLPKEISFDQLGRLNYEEQPD